VSQRKLANADKAVTNGIVANRPAVGVGSDSVLADEICHTEASSNFDELDLAKRKRNSWLGTGSS